MSTFKAYSVPTVINIVLYKNNYYDNLIIGALRREAFLVRVLNKNNFSVSAGELSKILIENFDNEIDRVDSLSAEILKHNVNSIFFLYKILNNFPNLELINITVSYNTKFTRVFKVNDEEIVGFDYKVVQGFVDFSAYLTLEELDTLNELLLKLNIIDISNSLNIEPYYIVFAGNIMSAINKLEKEDKSTFDYYSSYIKLLSDLIDPKLDEDQASLILSLGFSTY